MFIKSFKITIIVRKAHFWFGVHLGLLNLYEIANHQNHFKSHVIKFLMLLIIVKV
jgi:hypothetical protein